MPLRAWKEDINRRGWTLVKRVFSPPAVDRLTTQLQEALSAAEQDGESIRSRRGGVYAARNVLSLFPLSKQLSQAPPLAELLPAVLGPRVGLVRALFFDKPPQRSWSLPWHKDLTIAVRDNRLPSHWFSKPTTKAGVPHVEAPQQVLRSMLTLRIHLDEVTDENGPLKVIAGSHLSGKQPEAVSVAEDADIDTIYAQRGDVLAMRPLLTHSSGNSTPGTNRHRRIIHLEFTGQLELPDGYQWHTLILRPRGF